MNRYISKSYGFLLGVILFLVGLSLIFEDLFLFNVLWESLIIVWGIINIRQKDYFYALALLTFGVVFLVDTIFTLGITNILTGLFISALGIKILFQDMK